MPSYRIMVIYKGGLYMLNLKYQNNMWHQDLNNSSKFYKLYKEGYTVSKIASMFGVSETYVDRMVKMGFRRFEK